MFGSKFAKFLMLFFKVKVSSSSNFSSFFSVLTHNSSVHFWRKHNILSTKVAHQSAYFQTSHFQIHQIPYVIFETKSQFFFKLCITLQCQETWLFRTFLSKTKFLMSFFKPRVSFPLNSASPFSGITHTSCELFGWSITCFGQKQSVKVQFFRISSALMKVHPIPHAIFETSRSGIIQTLYHCSVSWKITPLYFCSSNLVYFEQDELIENRFSDDWVVALVNECGFKCGCCGFNPY